MVETHVNKTDRLTNVQIMRALAAVMVAFLHAQSVGLNNPHLYNPSFEKFNLVPLGNGVDIFFVISGFIITLASQRVVAERNVMEFIRRRLVRIVPLYWIALSIWIGMIIIRAILLPDPLGMQNLTLGNIVGSYLFFPVDANGFGPKYPFPLLDLGWTLNFEMLFYVIFAGCMMFGAKGFYPRLATVLLVLIAIGASPLVLPLPFSFWCQPITLEFLAGVALALAYRSGVRLNRFAQVTLIVAGIVVWMFVREQTFGAIAAEAKGSYSWPRVLGGGVGAAFIMAGAVLSREQLNNWLGRQAANLGDSSYAIYLTHIITYFFLRLALEALPFKISWTWVWTLVLTLSAIAVGHTVHLLIEKPVTKWLTRATRPKLALESAVA